MTIHEAILSKVLVHESSSEAERELKQFFQQKGLVGLKDNSSDILDLLESNTDLGAVFIAETASQHGRDALAIGRKIHDLRPELPIFLRRENGSSLQLDEASRSAFSGCYTLADMQALHSAVDAHLFSMLYPMPLIRGIQEISQQAFTSSISHIDALCETPYLVKDQIIYGELFSLIPLESAWCRGFMMLQTTEQEILQMIRAGKTNLTANEPGFRDVNGLLSEITNLIWGGIKSRFFIGQEGEASMVRTQVPILVNHKEKYISFGSQEPQLCFRYQIGDKDGQVPPITVYQKLVFNLSWRPEAFKESDKTVDDLVESGSLEFF